MLLGLFLNYLEMKKYLISGLVDTYRIKLNLFAISPNSAISVFKQKYPTAEDVYVIQDLFKNQTDLQC